MRRSCIIKVLVIMTPFMSVLSERGIGQGIRNEGGYVQIGPGASVNCQGGLLNNGGTITNGGTFSLSGDIINSAYLDGDGTLYAGGNWINSGTFDHGSGIVIFNGNTPQTITAPYLTVFNDLGIASSSAGTTIAPGAMVTVEGTVFNPNGKLTISSEGTENSGSLIYAGSGTPSGNITYRRSMPGGTLYRYISAPVGTLLLPSNADFWEWDEPAGDWGDPVTACSSGKGYTVTTAGEPLVFTGLLMTTVDMPATSPYVTDYLTGTLEEYNTRIARTPFGGGGWNLLGNPFTSALTIGGPGGFLDDNDGDGTMATNRFDPNYVAVYIYDGDSYHYRGKDIAFPDPISGEDPENLLFGFNNIQAGQGFFVLAMKDGVVFHFDREMQAHATNSVLLKSENVNEYWPGIMLKAKYGDDECLAAVIFNEQMTTGLDPGYDVGLLSSEKPIEIYTSLVISDNSVNFARQALPAENVDQLAIPVGVDSKNGGEVTFEAFTVPAGDKRFWLEDRAKGKITDIGNDSYTTILPADTYGTGRFYIIASANMPTGVNVNPEDEGSDLRIWAYDGMIIIKGTVSDGSGCELFNSLGSKILSCRLQDSELNTVPLPSGFHGLVIININDRGKTVSRKLVIP